MVQIGAVAATLMLAGIARADVFTFDATLASPDTNAATGSPTSGSNNGNNPSWYNGTANPQGGWTVSNGNGIEIGLRAKYRNVNGIIQTPNDDYSVLSGACVTAACDGGTPRPTYALWNYEFSIDLQPNGVGSLTLADIAMNTVLTVSDSEGDSVSVNPLTHWGDDTGFGSGGPNGVTSSGKNSPENSADWSVQNSENLGFSDSPLAGFFNPNKNDTYSFVLQVINNSGTVLATDDMEVDATPEPEAIILLATVLIGILGLRRRHIAAH